MEHYIVLDVLGGMFNTFLTKEEAEAFLNNQQDGMSDGDFVVYKGRHLKFNRKVEIEEE